MIFDGGREDTEAHERAVAHDARVGGIIAAVLAIVLLAAAVAYGQDGHISYGGSMTGSGLLPIVPDPVKTPGAIAATDQALVCATGDESYSRQHRRTSEVMKRAVEHDYNAVSCGEIDHRIPLSLGGADTLANLWCQPGPPAVWTYRMKDNLEDLVWRQTCHEHQLTLAQAQAIFLEPDWRIPYCAMIGGPPCPP